MTLDDFISSRGLTNAQFAERVGVDETMISRLRRGVVDPSASLMRRIYEASGKAVQPNSFFALDPAPDPSPLPAEAAP